MTKGKRGLVGFCSSVGWYIVIRFAAEIFRDLHDELMAIGGRGHDLMVRLQQLEAELPVVEKALLSEPNQLRFAYSPGNLLNFLSCKKLCCVVFFDGVFVPLVYMSSNAKNAGLLLFEGLDFFWGLNLW
jgi:hypothetical protein